MEKILDEFNEIENNNNKQNNIDNLLNKVEKLIEVNEKLIKDNEKRKEVQKTVQEQAEALTDEQYKQLLKHIENWGYETAFKLSGGFPTITIKTTVLAELFKSIYIAGMKGD